ncbi:hypothetical protein AAE026_13945 [Bradyrhizobium sp. DN5]|uniref:hypothetical protein n=1 Tax=Bradyrhizobium sp. DN5 TaxID=3056950 RepID=UPI003524EE4A
MAPIFRLQEEEPQLLTDAKQQEHCGNEAREQRVIVSTVSEFSNCAWQYDVRSSELQQTSISTSLKRREQLDTQAVWALMSYLLGQAHRLSVRFCKVRPCIRMSRSVEMDQFLSEQVQAPDAIVSVAFDKAWRFVEKDPLLAHNLKTVLHSRLRTFLECSIRNGERNTLNLANEAIRNLRAELTPSTKQ